MENLAYRLLLDLYYLHERPFNVCSTTLARQINLRDCAQEVDTILNEFFVYTDAGWINKRADNEIAHYRGKLEQAARAGKASAEKRAINARSTDVQPTNNQQPITNNHKPILKPIPAANAASVDGFAEFWEAYPKKTGKAAALKAWEKLKPKPLEACLIALAWQRHSEQWTKDGGQYVPNPSTYLAQGRWMDEPIQIKTKPKEKTYHEQLRETSDALCGRNRRDGEVVINGTSTRLD